MTAACTLCGLPADALVHHSTANGHAYEAPGGKSTATKLTASQIADALAAVSHVMRSGLTAYSVCVAEGGVIVLANPIAAENWRATFGDSLPVGLGVSAPLHVTAVWPVEVAS